MTDLDTLLSAPLAPVDDAGFSARVMQQVAREHVAMRERREIMEWAALAFAICILLIVVPLRPLSGAIEYIAVSLATSAPIALAAMAIILTGTWLRWTERV